MKNIALAALAAVATLGSIAPAAAQETVQVQIGYSDLDVASPAGTLVLAKRLEAGADTACARPDNRDVKRMQAWQECKNAVVTTGIQQLASKGIQLQAAN